MRVNSGFQVLPFQRPAIQRPVSQPTFGAKDPKNPTKDPPDNPIDPPFTTDQFFVLPPELRGSFFAPLFSAVPTASPFLKSVLTPREIKIKLDDYVIGQDTAKREVALAVHNHFKRVGYQVSVDTIGKQVGEVVDFKGTPAQYNTFLRDLSKLVRKLSLESKTLPMEVGKLLKTAKTQNLLDIKVAHEPVAELIADGYTAEDQKIDFAGEILVKTLIQEQDLKSKPALAQKLASGQSQVQLNKQNIIMIGPTGSGKTEIARTLAKILDVPFAIQNASEITSAGYIGGKAEDIIGKIMTSADNDVTKAERGIAFIDEIDKIKESKGPSVGKDVNGKGAQDSLLKIIEDAEVKVGEKKVNTKNMLFICAGAFEGLADIIAKRMYKKTSIGFAPSGNANSPDKMSRSEKNALLKYATPDDLIAYGLAPEFVGRMPVIVTLEELSTDLLKRILTEPKNALIKQYTEKFRIDGVTLQVQDDALSAIAEYAIQRGTGARGLQSAVNAVMKDALFDAPELDGPSVLTVTRQNVLDALKRSFSYEPALS